jgi:hypothetical protein
MANLNTTQFRSCGSAENLRTQFNALRADVTAIRTAVTTLTAKLDAEDVTNLDTNYAATVDPAALTSSDLTA